MKLEIAAKTDPGCVRQNNEDSLAVDEELGLLLVADGMGGHNSGEVASELASSVVRDNLRRLIIEGKGPADAARLQPMKMNGPERAKQLEHSVKLANQAIYEASLKYPKDHGMGTTVVAVLADPKGMTVAHVGDSRLYVFRKGRLEQLTEDHSLVADQVRRGVISKEEAESSGLQNVLTRALGTEREVAVEVGEHPVLKGDVLLLCSDGLTKMVSEPEIGEILAKRPRPLDACDTLIQLSRDRGGVDNITIVIARFAEPAGLWDRVLNLMRREGVGRNAKTAS